MLNRITGYLLFSQVSYLVAFIVLTTIDLATNHSLFWVFRRLRSSTGLEHTFTRVSDYLYYPFVFTAPINVVLFALFLWRSLRDTSQLSLKSDFHNILNALYISSSGWVLFSVFVSHLKN